MTPVMKHGALSAQPATMSDIWGVGSHLRTADQVEIFDWTGVSPETMVAYSAQRSDWCVSVRRGAMPLVLFGVGAHPEREGVGMPWMVATPEIENRRDAITFLRFCPHFIGKMHERYAVMANYVDPRNTAAVRWLEWCGFRFDRDTLPRGFAGIAYWIAERRVTACA